MESVRRGVRYRNISLLRDINSRKQKSRSRASIQLIAKSSVRSKMPYLIFCQTKNSFLSTNLGPSQSEFMAEGHSSRAIRYERSPRGKEVGAPSFVRQLWSCRRIRFYISIPKRKTPRR